jgi:hypothetical protein
MYIRHRGPPKISSKMKSDQRVGMKVAGDGCRTGVGRVKVAGVMVAEVEVAAVVVERARWVVAA